MKKRINYMNKCTQLVSVVIPTYNSEAFISEALISVLNQTYTNIEVIVIDDCSNDSTVPIINDFLVKDSRVIFHQLIQNSGAAIARNKGIQIANGEFIAFLDSDDKWLQNKIEIQLKLIEEKKCAVVFSSYYCMNEQGELLDKTVEALPELNFSKILKCNYIGNLTGMYSVSKIGKLYTPDIRKRQDWALWINAIKNGGIAYGVSEPLAIYRERKNSISSNKIQMLKYNFNIYKDVLGYSYLKSSCYMLLFLYEYFFVKSKYIKTSQPLK